MKPHWKLIPSPLRGHYCWELHNNPYPGRRLRYVDKTRFWVGLTRFTDEVCDQ